MYGYRMPAMPGVHRGLPSPYLTLVFSLNGPLPIQVPDGDRLRSGSFAAPVGGLHTRPVLLPPASATPGRPAPEQRGIELAVHPCAARALFGLPAVELAGKVLELADLLPDARELHERFDEPVDGPTAAALVTRWLEGRLCAAVPGQLPAELDRAWQLIVGSGGRSRIGQVATEVGWSRRHLTARLRAETGLGAKDLARVTRFQRSRSMLTTGRLPLSGVAADCGYADQSHLTAEWREFAGCTPGQWIGGELPTLAPDHHDNNRSHFSKT
jgi:AraC-like DNA-binding protein